MKGWQRYNLEPKATYGMVVYDEEKGEFVQITKKDVERWVKEAITDMYERPPE